MPDSRKPRAAQVAAACLSHARRRRGGRASAAAPAGGPCAEMVEAWVSLPRAAQLLAGTVLALAPLPSPAALLINEVLYDPAGPDAGAEWVELLNTGPAPATLEGVRLESGDGGEPGRWTRVWEGRAGEWIAAGGYFVVGGAYDGRPPDSPADCRLQNGPDGVRLVREELVLDRVGWGDLPPGEYCESAPAEGTAGGHSLGRRVDGADTDDNAADFSGTACTPGRPNHPRVDVAVALRRPGRPLPVAPGTDAVRGLAVIRNGGTEPLDCVLLGVRLDGRTVPAESGPPRSVLQPGDSAAWTLWLDVRPGDREQRWALSASIAGDAVPENDVDTLALLSGEPPLRLSEISPRPDTASTEWVELRAWENGPVRLEGWSLEDAAGTRLRFDPALEAPAGAYLLASRESWPARGGTPPGFHLPWSGAWPSLNDLATGGGAADTLFLLDPRGRIADWAAWGRTERGASWVRTAEGEPVEGLAAWRAVAAAAATPGAPNVAAPATPPPGGSLAPRGVSWERQSGEIWLRVPADAASGPWSVRLFDVSGRKLWERSGAAGDRGDRLLRWDGRDGLGERRTGIVIVELQSASGSGLVTTQRQPLVVAR